MQRRLRTLLGFGFLSAASVFALGKDRSVTPKIVEVRDVPMQQIYFEANKNPSDCNGPFVLPGRVCFAVYGVAWQTFSGSQKGINLIVDVWGDDLSGLASSNWSAGSLTFAIDGQVIDIPEMDLAWDTGEYTFSGNYVTLKDERLIRAIASGSEVWITLHSVTRASQKLSTKTLETMKAVLARYDSLEPSISSSSDSSTNGTQLAQLDAKIGPLVGQYRSLNDQSELIQKQCQAPIADRTCLERARDLIVAGQKVDESLIPLLGERISILNSMRLDASAQTEKENTLQMLGKLKAELASLPEILQKFDQAMAEQKPAAVNP